MIRAATIHDAQSIADLAYESVMRDQWPVKVSAQRILATTQAVIRDNASYCWVGLHDGKIEAAVAAEVSDNFWCDHKTAVVLMFYTRRSGLGIELLRHFARWVKARPVIKIAAFALEPGADPRIGHLLRRLGFTQSAPQFTYVRGLQ